MSTKVNKRKVLPVRDLFKFSPNELLKGLRTNLTIEFEDKSKDRFIDMSWKEVILQRYVMELLLTSLENGDTIIDLSKFPITTDYCINKYYVEHIFTSTTITKFLEAVFKTIVLSQRAIGQELSRSALDKFYFTIVNIYNTIYNDMVYSITDYVGSSRITDFMEIQNNDELLNSILAVKNAKHDDKHKAIANSYAVLDKILRDDHLYPTNDIRLGYVSGNINSKQVKQLLSCRGFITELDGSIFKYPVYTSFTLGMHNIHDLAIESRAGAKSLYTSNKAVQNSEYFARGLQLVTMILERLVDGDCGSKNYMDWYVKPDSKDTKSDLPNLLGKRYLNPDTGKEEVITKDHKHLEGKTIKIRSILRCALKDKRQVCMACFGDLGFSVPSHANLGHFCSVELSQKITQSILSTKHEMSSVKANDIKIADTTKEYMETHGSDYYLKPKPHPDIKYSIVVTQQEAYGIKDLTPDTKLHLLDPLRVSKIENVILIKEYKGTEEQIVLPIQDANRPGSFTIKFIEHIMKVGWSVNDKDNYVISLDKWNVKYPIFNLLELEYSFKVLNKEISGMFKGIKWKKGQGSELSPEVFLTRIFDMANAKLDINLALLEGIVYSFVIRDYTTYDYRLGGYSTTGEYDNRSLVKMNTIIHNRSLGAAYGWERVLNDVIKAPYVFNGRNAIDHPMDVTIKPDQVLKEYYASN